MNAEPGLSGSWLVLGLVGLAATAAGLGAGWYLRGSPPAGPAPALAPTSVRADGVTRDELEAAKREILAELERLGRQRSASPGPVAAPDSDAVIEIGRRVDALDARVALLSKGARTGIDGHAWASLRGPGSGSIDKIIERVRTMNALAQRHEKFEDLDRELKREHHLWMIDDVVRTYGPPEHIHTSDGLTLFYGRFELEDEEDPCYICFQIVEGFVARVEYDCNDYEW